MRDFENNLQSRKFGFTLAEMMVVMLIMSIVMAAMAPVMTTRMKAQSKENSSPWHWVDNTSNTDAFFNARNNGSSNAKAMIGQNSSTAAENARLIISTSANIPNHILFKSGNAVRGRLTIDSNEGIQLGNNTTVGNQSIAIGAGGDGTNAVLARGGRAIAIGRGSEANGLDTISMALNSHAFGKYSLAIGPGSKAGHEDDGSGDEIHALALGAFAEAGLNQPDIQSPIAIGYYSKAQANDAIAMGYLSSAKGASSIAIGRQATNSNTRDDDNSAAGANAIAIGYQSETQGNNDISIGKGTFNSGTEAIAMGYEARTTGVNGIALGKRTVASGANSISIGENQGVNSSNVAAYGATAENSIAIGTVPKATAQDAIAIGMGSVASGDYSIYLGRKDTRDTSTAEYTGASGYSSIAIGNTNMASGKHSIAIGTQAKSMNNYTIAIGFQSEASSAFATQNSDKKNIAIGYQAQAWSNDTIAIGAGATATTYPYGIAIGTNAKSAGQNNIAIGQNACKNVAGDNKICIGANSGPPSGHAWAKSNDSVERIFIGSKSNFNDGPAVLEVHNTNGDIEAKTKDTAVVINGNLVVKGYILQPISHSDYKNERDLGNGHFGLSWQKHNRGTRRNENKGKSDLEHSDNLFVDELDTLYNTDQNGKVSDRRLKYVGTESKSGLDKIRQLKVFNYTFKKDEKKTPHVGVIAQDLQKVFPNAVTKGEDGFLRIRMEDMFYAVINAIKELDAKVTQLLKQESEKDKRIKKLEEQNKLLETRLKALEAKIK